MSACDAHRPQYLSMHVAVKGLLTGAGPSCTNVDSGHRNQLPAAGSFCTEPSQ